MTNFCAYLTPEEALARTRHATLEELQALAARPRLTCLNCDEPEWKLGGVGLCFTCSTGEHDASHDFELIGPDEGPA